MSIIQPTKGRRTQDFDGHFSWERPGYLKIVNGIKRGWRTWRKGSTKYTHLHLGIDYANAEGTPILACKAGKIIAQFTDSDGARVIYQEVRVGRVYKIIAVYWHLKAGSFRLPKGAIARQGQVIASMGSTGKSTGPHLHFGLWRVLRGTPVRLMYSTATHIDPQPFINGKHLYEVAP